jgi:hypothetical protein
MSKMWRAEEYIYNIYILCQKCEEQRNIDIYIYIQCQKCNSRGIYIYIYIWASAKYDKRMGRSVTEKGIRHSKTPNKIRQDKMRQGKARHNNTTQDKTTQDNTRQHSTTQHNTTQHSTTQHNTVSHICSLSRREEAPYLVVERRELPELNSLTLLWGDRYVVCVGQRNRHIGNWEEWRGIERNCAVIPNPNPCPNPWPSPNPNPSPCPNPWPDPNLNPNPNPRGGWLISLQGDTNRQTTNRGSLGFFGGVGVGERAKRAMGLFALSW